ncbi:MAG: hypothetical protein EA409_13275 [Saprospirales bacterium]|nr:MAG: hypothetical protein EA409_13275 [Saprospirales bacterium]
MNERVSKYVAWGLVLALLQIFIFRGINFGWGDFYYVHILVYPVFIMILPINTPRTYVLLIAFFLGLLLDIFYLTPGIHSSALVFMAFIRTPLLNLLEPRGGYKVNSSPTPYHLKFNWFLGYASLMLFAHHLFYFSVEFFSIAHLLHIWMKTIFSFFFSMSFLLAFSIIFNPKY